jgi:hypothetical protein
MCKKNTDKMYKPSEILRHVLCDPNNDIAVTPPASVLPAAQAAENELDILKGCLA